MSGISRRLRPLLSLALMAALGLGAALVLSPSFRDGLGHWLQGPPAGQTVAEQLAVLRSRQGRPTPVPANHTEALLQCSQAQDLAVSVSLTGAIEDAQLANTEMRRICQAYFVSAARRTSAAAPRF